MRRDDLNGVTRRVLGHLIALLGCPDYGWRHDVDYQSDADEASATAGSDV